MADEAVLWLVTVVLPQKYWSMQVAQMAGSEEEARAFVQNTLLTLKFYVPDAALAISDVRRASADAS